MRNKFAAELHEDCSPPLLRGHSIDMLTKLLQIGVVGMMLCAASAWAEGNGTLQGTVKDPKGKPIKGADVRIEATGGGKVFGIVKTDASGRYTWNILPVGMYRVTLIVNGTVRSSINNTKTRAGQSTQLNFELTQTSASQTSEPAKKGKHYVWMPPKTGTNIGGRWVEVDENGNPPAGASNVQTAGAEAVHQMLMQSGRQGGSNSSSYGGGQ
jgi:Carboxypeptidase regulatory-like domain